ncbi:haloacid dehalogenase [Neptunitalea chrysea]|uniref:Haloacid dehalogenase n=1 Tax=Neptunitalea chrysea TaxID=1647581 RepID=A0A9W6B8P7_9FLAO|nr:HAD family hydrolase [Neptunitalea chrysea]GLB53534.1 haloacid dehalogenase [Neptunitalea chrysea]
MNLADIKLIATDMDGTLLDTKGNVHPKFFHLYKELKKHDIHFVAASGRQYHSIVSKLDQIKDEITVIAENGAVTKKQEDVLLLTGLTKQEVEDLVTMLRAFNDNEIFYVLCGKNQAYIEQQDENFINFFQEYYFKFQLVEDLCKVENDDFLKIAIFCAKGSENHLYPKVKHLEGKLQVKVSGEVWLDLSHMNANKGFALSKLQNQLGISQEETLVFGDYNNDLEMFAQAGISIAMKNAHPNILNAATYITKSNDEQGVEHILEQLLEAKLNKFK